MREITQKDIDSLALHITVKTDDPSFETFLDRRTRIEAALRAPNFFDRTAFRILFRIVMWLDPIVGNSRKRIFS